MNSQECIPAPAQTPDRNRQAPVRRPAYRTRQDESGLHLEVALPGVRKEDLKLTFHESRLRIEAVRNSAVPEDWKAHQVDETPGRYEFEARLQARYDGNQAAARFEDGVLSLQIPVREEARPREIAIA